MFVKKNSLKTTLCLALILWPCLLAASDYEHELKAINMVFEWKVDYASQKLRVRLTAKTKGWLGIGFNDRPVMKNADFIVGYVKNGETKIQDHFGVRGRSHMKDASSGGRSDISDVSGYEKDGLTTIAFSIPLKSDDKTDYVLKPDEEVIVMLAHGRRDSFNARHKSRTSLKATLATGQTR